jgi:NTP-dependent ternary system trypsin peptidase co-occuring protein
MAGYGFGMPEFVTVRTENGDTVPFELDDDYAGAVPAGRRWDNVVEKVDETLEHGVERAKAVARSVITGMRSMPPPSPDKVAVELGLKVTGTSGVAVAKCAAEAHIKITVEWQRDSISNNISENT